MIEMGITLALTAGSAILLCLWFRYTCLLLLTAKPPSDYVGSFAETDHLTFRQVQAHLEASADADIDKLNVALDRDFAALTRCNAGLGVEERMLQLGYLMNRFFVRLAGRIAPTATRRALREMTMVVAHLANSLGERNCPATEGV